MRKLKRNRGISRIDQPEKRTYGFFVRLERKGKTHNAFFADLSYGGKRKALKAAQKHYRKLLRKYDRISRRDWAQVERRGSRSGIVGVQRLVKRTDGIEREYWMATWSPRRRVHKRQMFSVRKYGFKTARALAVKARKAGLRDMKN